MRSCEPRLLSAPGVSVDTFEGSRPTLTHGEAVARTLPACCPAVSTAANAPSFRSRRAARRTVAGAARGRLPQFLDQSRRQSPNQTIQRSDQVG
jgi:hypothetical protein